MLIPKFTGINSEWIKYLSTDEYPTIYSNVIKETILIGTQGVYTLKIGKVLSINGEGYIAWIRTEGSGRNSETFKNYDECLKKGKEILHEESVRFEKEYQELRENQKKLK